MSYQPVVPLSGQAGWLFLSRTRVQQQAAFDRAAPIQRDTEYFASKIGKITSAEELVQDRRLLKVALGAFGLEGDINSRAFIRKVLEGGSIDSTSLANRLADKRYLQLAHAFGFGNGGPPNTVMSDFPQKISEAWRQKQFEAAIGQQNPDLRLAMGLGREIEQLLQQQKTDNGRWFAVMGNPPLRQVIQKALGLPTAFGALDIDRQLSGYREAAQRQLGVSEVGDLVDPAVQEQLIRRFLIRSEASTPQETMRGQIALSLLQSARR